MRIVATKRKHPTQDRLGYLQALLVESPEGWDAADINNLPTRSEVFVHAKFDESINKKFYTNELIVCDVNELENWETGDCMYGAIGTSCSNLSFEDDVFALLDLEGTLENQEHYKVQSIIRPSIFSFVRTTTKEGEDVICGPVKLISSTFNENESLWESRVGLVGTASRYFQDLKPYSVYIISVSNLPTDTIKIGNQFHSKGKNVVVGLSSFIRSVPVEQKAIVSDATLIKILDDALLKTSKLGRKGKRDAILQIEASKSLNSTMKPALLDLFSRLDQQEEESQKVILEVFAKYKINPALQTGDSGTANNALQQDLDELKRSLNQSNERNREAERELKVLTSEYEKNKSLDTSAIEEEIKLGFDQKLEGLENEVEDLRRFKKNETEIAGLAKKQLELQFRVDTLNESKVGLTETVARLQSELALTTGQFREKALSVLPFLEIMNNVKGDDQIVDEPDTESSQDLFVPTTLPGLISELSKRVQDQGYQADSTWLDLVSTLYLSNKFIGFFGSPGTGKTTLANCFNNALGIDKINCARVKVGRGWSSFVDFVGYDNSFTGRFKYKDSFYRKFENPNLDARVFYSIIFDEATLSSPEFYLSSFIDEGDPYYNDECEPINLDGHTINLPRDTRFILTFNVDETTERLSDRFISRMPIVYLSDIIEIDDLPEVKYLDFVSIDKKQSDKLIRDCDNENEQSETLLQEYDSRIPYWNKIMPEKMGTRKNKQIRRFLNLASNLKDVDPTLIVDFVEEVFLLPFVKGDGDEYREHLEEAVPKVKSAKARNRLGKIKSRGQKYNIYRHC